MLSGRNLAAFAHGAGAVRLAPFPLGSELADDAVVVRMLYAPINPADLLAIDGQYAFALHGAQPLGAEGVGVVEATGANVEDLHVGDMVLPLLRGNWSRERVMPRDELILLPSGLDPQRAAMLRINPATAWLLLDALGCEPGSVVVQNAAASDVGGWVRRIARERGVSVIDVVRKRDDALPEAIMDDGDLAKCVADRAAGRPVLHALDCVAGDATGRLAQCLGSQGRLLVFGHLSGDPVQVSSQLLTGRGLTMQGFSLRPTEAGLPVQTRRALFANITRIHAANQSGVTIRAIFPLSQIDTAIAAARTGKRGRILLDLAN